MNTGSHQVIFGAGPLGQAVMRALLKRGLSVTLINRSGKRPAGIPAEVEIRAADLFEPEQVRQAIQSAEVVYHTAAPDYRHWAEVFPRMQASIIDGVARAGAKLIMGDNLYMYGPVSGAIHEGLPYAAQSRKGRTRAQVAKMLLEAHQQGKVRAALGRGADFFGPGALNSTAGESIFGQLAKGKAASVLGNPDTPHTFTFIDDFGEALAVLGEREEALGQAWHIPNPRTVTTRQFVSLAAQALNVKDKMMVAGPLMMRVLGLFVWQVRELIEMEYEFTQPFVVDDSKYKAAFGDHSTPLEEGIRRTAQWYQSHG